MSWYYHFFHFFFLILCFKTFNRILSSSIESSDNTFFVDSLFSGLFESSVLGLYLGTSTARGPQSVDSFVNFFNKSYETEKNIRPI